jgi:hypothetical protein
MRKFSVEVKKDWTSQAKLNSLEADDKKFREVGVKGDEYNLLTPITVSKRSYTKSLIGRKKIPT